MQTIPYRLFLTRKPRRNRSNNYLEFYDELSAIYANRYYYETTKESSNYLYSAESTRPTEVINSIDIEFIYQYLLKHNIDALKYGHNKILTFEEYKKELDIYDMVLQDLLLEGSIVRLPHFLGVIQVKTTRIKKFNKFLKKKIPKKIIGLHWQRKFFDKRLLNVVQPYWFSVKIKNKELLKKLYLKDITHGYLFDIVIEDLKDYSKKI